MMDEVMKLNIKQWRLVNGFKQKEFAEKVGMKLSTYQSRENGKSKWKIDEVTTICDYLQISIATQLKY